MIYLSLPFSSKTTHKTATDNRTAHPYCLKGVIWTAPPHGAPELIAIAAVVIVHWWKSGI